MSKQQEYPYIGTNNHTGTTVFFHAPNEGMVLYGRAYQENHYSADWIETSFQDVTEQYLQNKDVPIESPEHSEYIQRMAFRYGYQWVFHGTNVSNTGMKYLNLWKGKYISCGMVNTMCFTELRLPLPPEHNTVKNLITKGTTVLVGGVIGVVALPKDNNNNYVVLLDGDVYTIAHESEIEELSQEDIKQHKIKSRLEEILLPYADDISVCDDIMNAFTLEEKL